MQQPIQVSFQGLESSPAITARARELAAGLERFEPQIMSCRVVVEAPHQHHHQGRLYHVKIQLHVAGEAPIVIDREGGPNHAHEDVYVALRDAFQAATRKLEDHARRHDHRARIHESPPHGKVTRLLPQEGYGFIETSDGLEVYFQEHAVVDGGFHKLAVGDEVRLEVAGEAGDQGPRASTVHAIGKHHPQPS